MRIPVLFVLLVCMLSAVSAGRQVSSFGGDIEYTTVSDADNSGETGIIYFSPADRTEFTTDVVLNSASGTTEIQTQLIVPDITSNADLVISALSNNVQVSSDLLVGVIKNSGDLTFRAGPGMSTIIDGTLNVGVVESAGGTVQFNDVIASSGITAVSGSIQLNGATDVTGDLSASVISGSNLIAPSASVDALQVTSVSPKAPATDVLIGELRAANLHASAHLTLQPTQNILLSPTGETQTAKNIRITGANLIMAAGSQITTAGDPLTLADVVAVGSELRVAKVSSTIGPLVLAGSSKVTVNNDVECLAALSTVGAITAPSLVAPGLADLTLSGASAVVVTDSDLSFSATSNIVKTIGTLTVTAGVVSVDGNLEATQVEAGTVVSTAALNFVTATGTSIDVGTATIATINHGTQVEVTPKLATSVITTTAGALTLTNANPALLSVVCEADFLVDEVAARSAGEVLFSSPVKLKTMNNVPGNDISVALEVGKSLIAARIKTENLYSVGSIININSPIAVVGDIGSTGSISADVKVTTPLVTSAVDLSLSSTNGIVKLGAGSNLVLSSTSDISKSSGTLSITATKTKIDGTLEVGDITGTAIAFLNPISVDVATINSIGSSGALSLTGTSVNVKKIVYAASAVGLFEIESPSSGLRVSGKVDIENELNVPAVSSGGSDLFLYTTGAVVRQSSTGAYAGVTALSLDNPTGELTISGNPRVSFASDIQIGKGMSILHHADDLVVEIQDGVVTPDMKVTSISANTNADIVMNFDTSFGLSLGHIKASDLSLVLSLDGGNALLSKELEFASGVGTISSTDSLVMDPATTFVVGTVVDPEMSIDTVSSTITIGSNVFEHDIFKVNAVQHSVTVSDGINDFFSVNAVSSIVSIDSDEFGVSAVLSVNGNVMEVTETSVSIRPDTFIIGNSFDDLLTIGTTGSPVFSIGSAATAVAILADTFTVGPGSILVVDKDTSTVGIGGNLQMEVQSGTDAGTFFDVMGGFTTSLLGASAVGVTNALIMTITSAAQYGYYMISATVSEVGNEMRCMGFVAVAHTHAETEVAVFKHSITCDMDRSTGNLKDADAKFEWGDHLSAEANKLYLEWGALVTYTSVEFKWIKIL